MVTEVTFHVDFKQDCKDWPEGSDAAFLFKAGVNYKVPTQMVEYFKKCGAAAPVGEPAPPIPSGPIELEVKNKVLGQGAK